MSMDIPIRIINTKQQYNKIKKNYIYSKFVNKNVYYHIGRYMCMTDVQCSDMFTLKIVNLACRQKESINRAWMCCGVCVYVCVAEGHCRIANTPAFILLNIFPTSLNFPTTVALFLQMYLSASSIEKFSTTYFILAILLVYLKNFV